MFASCGLVELQLLSCQDFKSVAPLPTSTLSGYGTELPGAVHVTYKGLTKWVFPEVWVSLFGAFVAFSRKSPRKSRRRFGGGLKEKNGRSPLRGFPSLLPGQVRS